METILHIPFDFWMGVCAAVAVWCFWVAVCEVKDMYENADFQRRVEGLPKVPDEAPGDAQHRFRAAKIQKVPDEVSGDAQHRFRAAKIQRGKERVREMKNAHRMAMGGNRNERNFSNH